MPNQTEAGTSLYVPISAVGAVLSDHLSSELVDRAVTVLTATALRLPTEGLDDLEPLLMDLEELKVKLAQTLERFEEVTA